MPIIICGIFNASWKTNIPTESLMLGLVWNFPFQFQVFLQTSSSFSLPFQVQTMSVLNTFLAIKIMVNFITTGVNQSLNLTKFDFFSAFSHCFLPRLARETDKLVRFFKASRIFDFTFWFELWSCSHETT